MRDTAKLDRRLLSIRGRAEGLEIEVERALLIDLHNGGTPQGLAHELGLVNGILRALRIDLADAIKQLAKIERGAA